MKLVKALVVISLLIACIKTGIGVAFAVSDEEFQSLKHKVMQLEKYSFPPDKAEAIKKVTQYVCPNGHIYRSAPDNMICPEDHLKVRKREGLVKIKLNRREAVGDQIADMLEEELTKRVNVAVSGTGIVQHIASSVEDTTKKGTFAGGSVDVYLISRPLKNTIFFMDLESVGGGDIDSAVPNNSGLNDDFGSLPDVGQGDQVRLREAWIQKSFLSQQIQFIIGKIDLTNYFDSNRAANDETSQFLSGVLINSPLIGNPDNGPGAVALFDTRRGFTFGLGVQDSDSSGSNVTEEPFSIAEMGLRTRLLGGMPGNFRVWAARNGETSEADRDDYSLGLSIDQEIGGNVILFGRASRAFLKAPVRDPHAWSAGVMLHNLIPQRRRDRIGIGYSHFLTPEGVGLSAQTENMGEVYYNLFLSDHLSISPIVQHLFRSAGTDTGAPQSDVLIFGLRTQVYF